MDDTENQSMTEENPYKCSDDQSKKESSEIKENFKDEKEPVFLKPIMPVPKAKPKKASEIIQISKDTMLSPAQKVAEKSFPLPYKEPLWSGIPEASYALEVLKGGVILDNIPIVKPFTVIGRSEQCDIKLEHPSISRYHCIVQYKAMSDDAAYPKGLYLYDLESTHGTFLNREQLKGKSYKKMCVGHIVKFGLSTRMFIVQGPSEEEEEPSPYTVTDLKIMAEERKKECELEKAKLEEEKKKEEEGIDWGMGEDAVEDNVEFNMLSSNQELSLDDPKKTLRGWYEREGYEMPNYDIEEIVPGQYRCKLELPFQNDYGSNTMCSVEHKGKKKDTVIQCALEACRIIDQRGLLRQSVHESHEQKKNKHSKDDYYDSDDDDFWDRTGDIERKRKQRKGVETMENYDSLKMKYDNILTELSSLELKIIAANDKKKKRKLDSDDLDEYISDLKDTLPDKYKMINWKIELSRLEKEEASIRMLLNAARPHTIEEFKPRKPIALQDEKCAKSSKEMNSSQKVSVHKAFMDDDEDFNPKKIKLSKLDDDFKEITAIPYSKKEIIKGVRAKHIPKKVDPTVISDIEIETNSQPVLPIKSKPIVQNNFEKNETDLPRKDKVIGPMLPPSNLNKSEKEDFVEFKKPILVSKPKKKEKPKKSSNFENNIETWVPPSGQTGDGRTALNDKLGY